jgi:small subunit ribosomal protein S7
MRKTKPKKRIILPDPKFKDVLVTRFVNSLMVDGKKSIAFKIFYDALDIVGKKMKDSEVSPLDVWKKGLLNITPMVEVKSRRVGGANFQVPMEIRPERKVAISMHNLIQFATLWQKSLQQKLLLHTTKKEGHSKRKKIHTGWLRQTGRLPISVFN